MIISKEIHDAIIDIIENYDFKKSEQKTIYMFIQTLVEYKIKEEKK